MGKNSLVRGERIGTGAVGPGMWRDGVTVVLLVSGVMLGAVAALDWVGYSTFVLLTAAR